MSFVLEKTLQKHLERYGSLLEFELSTRESSARVKVLLKGEREPVAILIKRYELAGDADHAVVVIREISSSREWLTLALEDFVVGRSFPIPQKYTNLARLLL